MSLQQHYRGPIFLDNLSSSLQSATTSTSLVSSSAQYETATHSSSSSHETGVITGGSSGLSDIISLDWILVHLYWPVTKTTTLKSSQLSENGFDIWLWTSRIMFWQGPRRTAKKISWVGQQQYCFKMQTWIKLFPSNWGNRVTHWLSSISCLIGRAEQNKRHKWVDWKAQTRPITALLSPLCVLLQQFCSWNGSKFSAAAHFICLFDFSSAITFC